MAKLSTSYFLLAAVWLTAAGTALAHPGHGSGTAEGTPVSVLQHLFIDHAGFALLVVAGAAAILLRAAVSQRNLCR